METLCSQRHEGSRSSVLFPKCVCCDHSCHGSRDEKAGEIALVLVASSISRQPPCLSAKAAGPAWWGCSQEDRGGGGGSVWVPPTARSPVRKGGPEPLVDFVGEDAEPSSAPTTASASA